VIVNEEPAVHDMSTVTFQGPRVVPEMVGVCGEQFPLGSETERLEFVGCVQPAGTVNVTDEPGANEALDGAVNVKTKELPVEPATVVVGDTVMVPEPEAAPLIVSVLVAE
jgi:hypothetical protein